jgi:phosphatidylglycerol:prolipoprotein diacylglycerol transferase
MNRKTFAVIISLLIVSAVVALFFLLRPYFAGEKIPDRVFMQIGRAEIRWNVVLALLALLMGINVTYQMAKNWGIKPFHVLIIPIIYALMALIFARLFACVLNREYYLSNPIKILDIANGNMSARGAVLGVILGCLIYAVVSRIHILRVMDLSAVLFVLGQAISRWGNFFNQERFGYPTDLPWKMYIAPENRLEAYQGISYFHPAFLYEFIAYLLLSVLLIWRARKRNLAPGVVAGLYLIGHGLIRTLIQFVRIRPDDIGFFNEGLVTSVITMLVGGSVLLFVSRREQRSGSTRA